MITSGTTQIRCKRDKISSRQVAKKKAGVPRIILRELIRGPNIPDPPGDESEKGTRNSFRGLCPDLEKGFGILGRLEGKARNKENKSNGGQGNR